MLLKRIIDAFRQAVFPTRCVACRRLFPWEDRRQGTGPPEGGAWVDGRDAFRHLMSPFLCEKCLPEFNLVESPICPRCGMMFRERVSQDHLCGECLTEGKHVDFARSFGVYEKSLMHVIKAYKYKGKTQLAKPLGRLLFHLYGKCYGSGPDEKPPPDVIMPVPLHRKRLRERGFNQAYLILKEWPRLFQSVHPDSCPIIIKGGVVRKKRTRPQAGLDRLRRKANIKGAFTLSRSFDVNGKRVLLVDDVYTTGATAEECARVLLKGGAWSVDILTVSRTVS